jgi:hypothetical protein
LFLEAEQGGDFGGGFGEGEGEFAVVHLLVGGHEEIEVEGEVFGSSVEDDADGGAGDLVFAADVADDLRFHFDGIGVGGFPESALFGGGGGDAVGAVKAGWASAGGEQARLKVWCVVAGEEDGAEGEVWVKGTGESAGENQAECWNDGMLECWIGGHCGLSPPPYVGGYSGADGFLGIALAHAGEEDSDVWAGADCGHERSGFFFDGEAD